MADLVTDNPCTTKKYDFLTSDCVEYPMVQIDVDLDLYYSLDYHRLPKKIWTCRASMALLVACLHTLCHTLSLGLSPPILVTCVQEHVCGSNRLSCHAGSCMF